MDRPAVKFRLPYGDLFVQIPGATGVIVVTPLPVERVVVELRAPRGELLSVAAYRDLQALMGREAPIVWARGADGAPIRVTAHTSSSLTDGWWEGVLEHVVARDNTAPQSVTATEGRDA